jgi:hypothetical protein
VPGVDPVTGHEHPGGDLEIGGRDPDGPAATVATDDGADEGMRPAERSGRPVELARREPLADRRGRDRDAVEVEQGDGLDLEPVALTLFDEGDEAACGTMPEAEVGADDDAHGVEPVGQHLGDELPRGGRRQSASEG